MNEDAEIYADFLNTVENHEAWALESGYGDSAEEMAEAAASGEEVGYVFEHRLTDGQLSGRMPDLTEEGGLTVAYLEQPLEDLMDSVEGEFTEALSEKHGEIASEHETEYASAESHPLAMVRVEVPDDYSSQELERTLDQLSEASVEVDELHSRLFDQL